MELPESCPETLLELLGGYGELWVLSGLCGLWVVWGRSWEVLGVSWVRPGVPWGGPGAPGEVLGGLGGIWGRSWGVLGRP